MAGGNVQPGTSAPGQMPPTYGQQMPQTYGQPYTPTSAPMDIAGMLRKTFLLIIIGIGALFMFIGRLMMGFVDDTKIVNVIISLGGFAIALPAIVWALGSKRTTDMQNLGLLIIAGLMFAAMVYY